MLQVALFLALIYAFFYLFTSGALKNIHKLLQLIFYTPILYLGLLLLTANLCLTVLLNADLTSTLEIQSELSVVATSKFLQTSDSVKMGFFYLGVSLIPISVFVKLGIYLSLRFR